jgi:hypothetical protein
MGPQAKTWRRHCAASPKPSGLRELAGVVAGHAKPLGLKDHHGMLPAKATIVSDEGHHVAENTHSRVPGSLSYPRV